LGNQTGELRGLVVGARKELVGVFCRRMGRGDFQHEWLFASRLVQLSAQSGPVDEAFIWTHVVHKVTDTVGELHGDKGLSEAG